MIMMPGDDGDVDDDDIDTIDDNDVDCYDDDDEMMMILMICQKVVQKKRWN